MRLDREMPDATSKNIASAFLTNSKGHNMHDPITSHVTTRIGHDAKTQGISSDTFDQWLSMKCARSNHRVGRKSASNQNE